MGDGDEGPGGAGAGGDLGATLLPCDGREARRVGWLERRWQPNGENVPELAIGHGTGVDLGAEDGGEAGLAEGHRVGDRVAVGPDEMVGQGEEVIALGTVAPADLLRRQAAV